MNAPGLWCLVLASKEARRAHGLLDQGLPGGAFEALQAAARYLTIAALQPPEWMHPGHFLERWGLVRSVVKIAADRFGRGLALVAPLDVTRPALVW